MPVPGEYEFTVQRAEAMRLATDLKRGTWSFDVEANGATTTQPLADAWNDAVTAALAALDAAADELSDPDSEAKPFEAFHASLKAWLEDTSADGVLTKVAAKHPSFVRYATRPFLAVQETYKRIDEASQTRWKAMIARVTPNYYARRFVGLLSTEPDMFQAFQDEATTRAIQNVLGYAPQEDAPIFPPDSSNTENLLRMLDVPSYRGMNAWFTEQLGFAKQPGAAEGKFTCNYPQVYAVLEPFLNGRLATWPGTYHLPLVLRGYEQPDGSFEHVEAEVVKGPVLEVTVPPHAEKDEDGEVVESEVSVAFDGKPLVGRKWNKPQPLLTWEAEQNDGVHGRLTFFRDFELDDGRLCNWIAGSLVLEGTGTTSFHGVSIDYAKGKPHLDVGGLLDVPDPKPDVIVVDRFSLSEKILIGLIAAVGLAILKYGGGKLWSSDPAVRTRAWAEAKWTRAKNAVKRTLESWKPECCKAAGVDDGPPSLSSVELSNRDQRDSTAAEGSRSVMTEDGRGPSDEEKDAEDDARDAFGRAETPVGE